MLIHRQSHQEYLFFLHETKVHLDSSQCTKLRLEFGAVREKLRLLDLDPVMEYLSSFYSHLGRPAKKQTHPLYCHCESFTAPDNMLCHQKLYNSRH